MYHSKCSSGKLPKQKGHEVSFRLHQQHKKVINVQSRLWQILPAYPPSSGLHRVIVVVFCIFPDLDECTTNSFDCAPNAACQNTEGSYACSCKSGYKGNGKICNGNKLIMITQIIVKCNSSSYPHGSGMVIMF